jgi:outer membrane protein insertion porin family
MSYCRQVTSLIRPAIVPAVLIFALFSCRVPVDFPRGKPFVFKTSVQVNGDMKSVQKQDLTQNLENQIDDSLQAKTITAFNWPWKGHVIYKKLENPPVYDSMSLSRSLTFMNALMYANGYYAPVIKDTVIYKTVHPGKIIKSGKLKGQSREEQRVYVKFDVTPGRQLVFDSVGFRLYTPELQSITMESRPQSLIKVGQPYSRTILNNEISRLVDSFRNNGYFRFSREDLYIEQDTVFAALIDPSLDPIEQAELLEKFKQRKENPTITIIVKQRPVRDSTHLRKFYIGDVTVYPDLPVGEDTIPVHTDTVIINKVKYISRTDKFKLSFISDNIYMYPGGLYRQQDYFRTANRLSQFSAWEYNNIEFQRSPLNDSLLDLTLHMYPAKKQKLSLALETSYNTNSGIITTGNLFGTSLVLGLQNRNAYRQSILTNTNLTGGIELGTNGLIQTVLTSASHTIAIPHIIHIIPFLNFPANLEEKGYHTQTLINVNAGYVYRFDFFTQVNENISFGYQWSKIELHKDKDLTFSVTKNYLWKPINIENYSYPVIEDSFKTLLQENPPLQISFRPGLVIGQQFAYNLVRAKGNKINYLLLDFEESGALLGFFKTLDKGALLRYIRAQVEFRHTIDYGKNQMAFRAYAGAGYAYGLTDSGYEHTLPSFKAFYAGGPNSMRAWRVRNLGLGSSKYYTDSLNNQDLRYGDMKLEFNAEYRFLLGTLFGIKFRSALFTDIGNIWSWQPIDTSSLGKGSNFQFSTFYKELAVGAGTGLRIDFNYFLIRFDWSYKIHDPEALEGSESWFYKLSLGSGQLQLGLNYPF